MFTAASLNKGNNGKTWASSHHVVRHFFVSTEYDDNTDPVCSTMSSSSVVNKNNKINIRHVKEIHQSLPEKGKMDILFWNKTHTQYIP